MQGLHAVNGVLLVAVNALAGALGVLYVRRRGEPSRLFSHLLVLGQTLLVAQAALGLLMLSGGERDRRQAPLPVRRPGARRGARAVALRAGRPARPSRVVLRGGVPRRRARRARLPDRIVRRIGPTLRGFAIIFAAAGVITALQLDDALAAVFFVVRIAFFVAIALFLYRLWRERREEISQWGLRSRVVFYGAVGLAIANIGAAFAPQYPSGGLEALIFFLVLAACVFACWRVWRDEHTYGY